MGTAEDTGGGAEQYQAFPSGGRKTLDFELHERALMVLTVEIVIRPPSRSGYGPVAHRLAILARVALADSANPGFSHMSPQTFTRMPHPCFPSRPPSSILKTSTPMYVPVGQESPRALGLDPSGSSLTCREFRQSLTRSPVPSPASVFNLVQIV